MSNLHPVNVYLKKQIHSLIILLKAKHLLLSFFVVAALVITLFLYEAEPFNISRLQEPFKILKLLGYGFIYSGMIGLYFYFTPKENIYPAELNLTSTGKMIVILIILILNIGILNWLYTFYIYDEYLLDGSSLLRSVKHAFTFSLFPFLLYIVHLILRTSMAQPSTEQDLTQLVIWFEKFKFIVGNILYIAADENYIMVYYLQDNKSEKQYIRYSLKKAEEQLSVFKPFLRVQRSYIVNLNQIKDYVCEQNSMKLNIYEIDEQISVRRDLRKTVKSWMDGRSW